ncbi:MULTISPECIES: hypothetical protein [Bacillus cereus group]|uniref:hypothetical protein n=1 Tax=Bacillus cereus group TaxID=86661 RepID=UPI000BF32AC8|nr:MULTISPECIES: hypothetical protein [Bacillus cereus group]MCU5129368.1 hypothetical protein [Bacillus cereus]MCU5524553.1 hypothetical protein [Bacillus cereus]MCU5542681.1 hypothetical protein [Bacillus cereus]MDF3551258.1 hypothetical protein [Bacillus cereus]PFA77353.1 hypothetical protein CN400_30015 [Bacillus thuringiensis]
MLKREERTTYENTSFFSMLKSNGISSLTVTNFGFYLAVLIGIISYFTLVRMKNQTIIDIANYISNILPGVSASILGIIIAGLSIVVALTSGKIFHLLLKNKTLQNLLFPFWYAATLWGILLFVSMSFPILIKTITIKLLLYILTITFSFFVYTLCGTIALIGNTIRIMIILADLNNDQ